MNRIIYIEPPKEVRFRRFGTFYNITFFEPESKHIYHGHLSEAELYWRLWKQKMFDAGRLNDEEIEELNRLVDDLKSQTIAEENID